MSLSPQNCVFGGGRGGFEQLRLCPQDDGGGEEFGVCRSGIARLLGPGVFGGSHCALGRLMDEDVRHRNLSKEVHTAG